jgi:hypothetical protein
MKIFGDVTRYSALLCTPSEFNEDSDMNQAAWQKEDHEAAGFKILYLRYRFHSKDLHNLSLV